MLLPLIFDWNKVFVLLVDFELKQYVFVLLFVYSVQDWKSKISENNFEKSTDIKLIYFSMVLKKFFNGDYVFQYIYHPVLGNYLKLFAMMYLLFGMNHGWVLVSG